ncbi:MAG: choice-of-anchor J domain-containing protein, partial [Duncaniella sp.]|nr:choice-of-anchor J domain-containing protein [Duncaniella sp.]
VGKATSIPAVTDVVAEPVADNEKAVNLTFTQPEPTTGYMDPADVAYRITRSDNGATAITLEDAWQGEQPYVDNTIPELGSYVYHVYTIYNGNASFSSVASNAVVTGGCASLPYSQDFSGAQSGQLYTFFHGEDGTRDWSRNSSAALNYWGGTTADAYAVTPKFALESGKAYELTFDTHVSRAASPKNLAVKIGLTPTVEGLNEELWSEAVSNTLNNKISQIFSVPATGEYYIAFHCFGESNSDDIYVDNITLAEIVATPKPVTDLAATPAAEGALKVTVSWTNPSESTAGETLDVIEKVEVLRGTDVVATLENLEGGSASTYEDTVAEAGTYTYSV